MKENKAPAGTVKKILSLTKGSRLLIFLSLVFAFCSVVLTLYLPLLFGRAIDFIISPGNVDTENVIKTLMKASAFAAGTALLNWIMNTVNNKISYAAVRNLRDRAYEKINSLPISYIDSHRTGDTVSRLISDADRFSEGLLMGFTQLFTGIATICGTLVFMVRLNFAIALSVVILTPLSLFAAKFIARHTYKYFRGQAEINAVMTSEINEFTGNMNTVKSFGREKDCFLEFSETNEKLRKTSLKAIFFSSITNPSTRFINSVIYAAVALVGALSVIKGESGLTVGMLVSLLSFANQYTKPFNEISGVAAELQNSLLCASRVIELTEEEGEKDRENAEEIKGSCGNIEFSHVSFSYTPGARLIEDFSLKIRSGEKIAVAGHTGSGKTTLINLLMGFYDTDSGDIFIDGKNIRDIKKESLRRVFGMVLQDTWLKKGTVRENITIGKPDATDEEIIRAAKKSYAWSFIKRLPQGLGTYIGEDGGSLSEGQKQLLCITRVMLTSPDILILDEATSSIDTRTEIKIRKAFLNLMEGRTSFIVAHRLSTIKGSDRIIVMDKGNIAETGTHRELLDKNGLYADIFRSQFEE